VEFTPGRCPFAEVAAADRARSADCTLAGGQARAGVTAPRSWGQSLLAAGHRLAYVPVGIVIAIRAPASMASTAP
jgi:hypothetical protein